ncbi:arrestin domain-containing protein 2-like isoform X1 [Crassostrea angulata]|uniref:arrestin domain-containing protein 2-like isoform X1 n=1 Tax=Magallana angulata TaxID=2784310 RepID=UPI0022B0ABE5|nr:arrestin domain-containing protein 2-like isoform X1 [Crassostrea angulata]
MSGIAVTLELKGNNVFLAGERVQGTWFVNVNSAAPVKVNFITTYLIGATYVEWRETNYLRRDFEDDEFKTHELYTRQVTSHPVNGHGKQLAPGYYKYPFDYYIPKDNMHSSFEGHHGATRWFIKIEIGRPKPCSNIVKYKCFTYLAKVDIDLPLYAKPMTASQERKISRAFGFGNAGSVKLTASIDRSGYCPGEWALITLDVTNGTTKDLDQPSAALMQMVEFKGNGEENITKECIRKLVGTKLNKGQQLKWNNRKLTIDPVPPTSLPRSSYCIKCLYYIEIKIPLPCYNEDIKLLFPITIGTVPRNHKKRQNEMSPPSNDAFNNPDLSNSITYREQEKSTSRFEYSSNTLEFPNILYTPLTAYVVEYTPTASGTAHSTSSLKKS